MDKVFSANPNPKSEEVVQRFSKMGHPRRALSTVFQQIVTTESSQELVYKCFHKNFIYKTHALACEQCVETAPQKTASKEQVISNPHSTYPA